MINKSNFADINLTSVLKTQNQLREFEFRKAEVFTCFERTCAQKPDDVRRNILFSLDYADSDFDEGSFNGTMAIQSFDSLKQFNFRNTWIENLKYAYWFSLPQDRAAFKNHLSAGVVAIRPKLKEEHPATSYQAVPTAELGKRIYDHQIGLLWSDIQLNSLLFMAQEKVNSTDKIIQVVRDAQKDADTKGLNAGIQTIKTGLFPYFLRSEYSEITEGNQNGISRKVAESITQKQQKVEPYLENFAYLFLTHSKFHQGLIIRSFLEKTNTKEQTLLPLTYPQNGRERE